MPTLNDYIVYIDSETPPVAINKMLVTLNTHFDVIPCFTEQKQLEINEYISNLAKQNKNENKLILDAYAAILEERDKRLAVAESALKNDSDVNGQLHACASNSQTADWKDLSLLAVEEDTKAEAAIDQKALTSMGLFQRENATNSKPRASSHKRVYLNYDYPKDHWAYHAPSDGDSNFIAKIEIFGTQIAINVNEGDARGYRLVVKLVQDDMGSTFNRAYSDEENAALGMGLALVSSLYSDLGMAVNTEIAGNNSQSLEASGFIKMGNEHEPSILHGHIIGRGNPATCYISDVPLRGPVVGRLFNMRGDSHDPDDEGNTSKVKWEPNEMETIATILASKLEEKLNCSKHYSRLVTLITLRTLPENTHLTCQSPNIEN